MLPLWIALQFLSSLPIRLPGMPEPEQLGRSLLFYPLVGLLFGLILWVLNLALSGAPLLLIMGFTANATSWEPALPVLTPHHRVIAFDNRGSGRSDQPEGPYTMAQLADDAIGVSERQVHLMQHAQHRQTLVMREPAQ